MKILTVQKTSGGTHRTPARERNWNSRNPCSTRNTPNYTQAPTTAVGVVVIFDSEDGGMVAATLPTLQQWKAGTLSDQAFWRRCFFDPPEIFTSKTGQ